MLLDPARLPRLPVTFMNADHAEEARLLDAADDLAAAFRAGTAGAAAVIAALDALYVHTRAHFEREEAAMRDSSFPGYSFHQAEHVRLLGELGEVERAFREEEDAVKLSAFLASIPGWLTGHIDEMDAATARYLAEWGGR